MRILLWFAVGSLILSCGGNEAAPGPPPSPAVTPATQGAVENDDPPPEREPTPPSAAAEAAAAAARAVSHRAYVAVGEVHVTQVRGPLRRDVVDQTVRLHQARLQTCYAHRRISKDERFTFAYRFTVQGGNVGRVSAVRPDREDLVTDACVRANISAWPFPDAGPAQTSVSVSIDITARRYFLGPNDDSNEGDFHGIS